MIKVAPENALFVLISKIFISELELVMKFRKSGQIGHFKGRIEKWSHHFAKFSLLITISMFIIEKMTYLLDDILT